MDIYGSYNNEIIKLDEISLSINTYEELVLLNNFISQCIKDIKKDSGFEHKHFTDYLNENKILHNESNDIIIYKTT